MYASWSKTLSSAIARAEGVEMVAAWLAREMVLVVAGANAEIVDAPKRMVVAVSKFMVDVIVVVGGGSNDNRVDGGEIFA